MYTHAHQILDHLFSKIISHLAFRVACITEVLVPLTEFAFLQGSLCLSPLLTVNKAVNYKREVNFLDAD